MRAVVCIDSFKGSLPSLRSGAAVAEAIRTVYPNAEVTVAPLADGGEGTVEAVVSATGGRMCRVSVTGPLGEPIEAEYGVIPESRTAVIEMSAAAGITLVPNEKRDPLVTTTYGVGELILHAIREEGCRDFLIGIGGSATNDGGAGMLSALGFELLDREGREIPRGAVGLSCLTEIRTEHAAPELSDCRFRVACDVKNPLCGENGCSAVYGPQKGADPDAVVKMDGWLSGYARMTAKLFGRDMSEYPGAGAAGGMGFALIAYLGASLESGVGLVIEATGLRERLRLADIVVTGEGRLDGQSCMGKAPVGVARAAKEYSKPVIAFCGAATDDAGLVNAHGIDAFFPILRAPATLAEAMDEENAYENLRVTAEQVFRLIRSARND